ncbi:bifunctional dihydrofolate reductase-thymidylate synthase isoform X2 [Jatropha curcas]|uniref:bifunctional dihydrofolate reductase-thymidylate synthase isoform X2 n=1 Tax=Jatropha curcas TaxID=180498 RepID=UPI00189324E9|nr:bifunctional dihydrofolate reductase-thymidylate synthase isoform X2 [Jatropha curcas]
MASPFSMVLLSSYKNSLCNPYMASASQLERVSYITLDYRSYGRFSLISGGDVSMSIRGSDANVHPISRRTYQIVVAATRDMGIGKDGKLPWRLPTDLKFFKEITLTTSSPEKKNAVVMGRKTWESIPPKYRPLPGRLNVVLTRSESFAGTATENTVICGSIPSALKLLAEEPYSFSIEKVFVIGGGQILRETLNAPGCDAIHITEIETNAECDTFIPAIDLSLFRLLHSSPPLVENNVQYSFVTYVPSREFRN